MEGGREGMGRRSGGSADGVAEGPRLAGAALNSVRKSSAYNT